MSESSGSALHGSLVMLFVRIVQRSLGLLSTLVLARLLLPSEFGIVAIALLVMFLAETLADSGARVYIVQRREIDDRVVDSAWTLDLCLKGAAALLLLFSYPLHRDLWSDERVALVIVAIAPSIVVRALVHPQLHVDARRLHYRRIVIVEMWQRIAGFVFVVGCALAWRSHWAIVIGHYAAVGASVFASWRLADRPVRPSLSGSREQWRFSRWIVSRGFLGYFRAQTDAFLIARYYSAGTFGTFSMSREIAVMPALDLVRPLTQPLLASLARARDDRDAAATQVRVAMLGISLLVAPLCALFVSLSEPLILVVLGADWAAAAPILAAMAPLLLSYAISGVTNNLMLALGRVRTLFLYDAISMSILMTTLYALHSTDIELFVLARSLIGLAVTFTATAWVATSLGVRPIHLLVLCAVPIGLAAIAGAVTLAIGPLLSGPVALQLVASTAVLLLCYGLLVLLWYGLIGRHGATWRRAADVLSDAADYARARLPAQLQR